jgi:hypothetical protein
MKRALALSLAAALGGGAPALAGTDRPDLTASASAFELELDTNVPQGDVNEGCANAATGVDLLRFDSRTYNEGAADLAIGDPGCPNCLVHPEAACENPEFHCSPAGGHNHAHFTNYAKYELRQGADVVATGGKFGFCLEDTLCPMGTPEKFNCENQGLTAGCEDLYSKFLGCQYIDVTGLLSGEYTLRVTVDPGNKIEEENEDNNFTEYTVMIAGTEEPDYELPGTALEIKQRPNGTQRMTLLAKAETTPISLPSPPVAPTVGGALLSLLDVGGVNAVELTLPADGWKGLGRPAGAKGYRFRGGKNDPCSVVKITPDRLKATCTLPDYALPAGGTHLALQLVVGSTVAQKRYCGTFGGTQLQNDAKKLRRVNAPPAACEVN